MSFSLNVLHQFWLKPLLFVILKRQLKQSAIKQNHYDFNENSRIILNNQQIYYNRNVWIFVVDSP
jgi:hypothetical protein